MKLVKVLLFVFVFLFLVFFASCINGDVLIPDRPLTEKTEIPAEVFEAIRSVADLKAFLWQNYNYTRDEIWSGYRDYPLTPAEFFMSEILINGVPVSKNTLIGDCEDYAALTAFLLWKA